MRRVRQLFTYSGSKFRLSEDFAEHYVKHRRFVSLFGGSAGEFAGKEPSPVEVYNDLDDLVFNVFRVLQTPKQSEQLLALLHNTPNGQKQYQECRRILDAPPRKHSRVRRAWAFLVCGNTCVGGVHPAITRSWSTACDTTDRGTRSLLTLPQRIEEWRTRFLRVRLENADWYKVFTQYDRRDTLTFADPPYHPATLRSGGRLYRCVLAVHLHSKLLQTLNSAKGYVMLCGYNHPLYTANLFHWRNVTFGAKAYMGKMCSPRQEVIWMNYLPDGTKIGGNKLLIAKRYVDALGSAKSAQKYLDRIKTLLSFPKPQDAQALSQPVWLEYTNDGRSLVTTKLLIAKRYIELLGGPVSAQRYLDRIVTLMGLPK